MTTGAYADAVAPWQTTASRPIYANPWVEVTEYSVVRPDGSEGIYGVLAVRHPAVFIVALNDDDEVALATLDRYTVGRSVEVPAGGTDGQDPLQAAQRELLEETGLRAERWTRIGTMQALNGVCRAPEHVFLATGLSQDPGGAELAAEGISEVRFVPFAEAVDLVARGEITDGETIAALMFAAIHLGRLH